ncbi:TPA: KilA-N domain-containing protein [Klebsiella pneumoniae]
MGGKGYCRTLQPECATQSEWGREKERSELLALEGTKQLISELERQTTEISVVTKEGKNGGTFAHELLAIEYAGWISSRLSTSISMLKRRWY